MFELPIASRVGVTFLRMDINSALNPSSFPTDHEHEEDLEIRADEVSSEPIQRGAAVRSSARTEGTIKDNLESRQIEQR